MQALSEERLLAIIQQNSINRAELFREKAASYRSRWPWLFLGE
ncbi:hypothetical protein PMI38_01074 [Pseudomonas sp. GM84]|nr:hypothetical protein [Pseudomonas sp. GM84]EJN39465.1 hypothetical protein PMI38_01074 [Pseudomonas sp. GM84]